MYLEKAKPRPRRPSPRAVGVPAGALRRRLDHRARARILQVAQAELHRIGAGRRGQLVDERLEREHVGVAAERARARRCAAAPRAGSA